MKELVFHRLLLPALERWSTKTGFHDGDYHATYAQHGDRVMRLCSVLGGLGLGREDRVAVLAANSHRYLELYHAAFLGAATINPLNLRLAPPELAFILADSATEVLFTDSYFAPVVEQVRAGTSLREVVLLGEGDVAHDSSFEERLSAAEPVLPEEPEEDDMVVLMYTGGTTGLPKGVVHTQRSETLNMYHIGIGIGLDEHRVFLHQTPMFHAASMPGILGIPMSGGTSVLLPFFDPAAVLDAVERHAVTQTVMVPTMIALLFQHEDFLPARLASLRILTYGASPMPGGLLGRIRELFPDLELTQGYGMTEAATVLTLMSDADHRRGGDILTSCGRPVAGTLLSIRDRDGASLPVGEEGEVCARAGNFMREYWNRPEDTAEAFRDGWYHTGDMGRVDEEGYLYLVDRVKDMIVSGGENVYSVEVENAISTHPGVAMVAVIGIPHEVWGEQVHAIVVPKPGAAPTEDEIVEHARSTIAGYKGPKAVQFRDSIPLSGAMKPLKRELRKPFWEGHERGVH